MFFMFRNDLWEGAMKIMENQFAVDAICIPRNLLLEFWLEELSVQLDILLALVLRKGFYQINLKAIEQ